MKDNFYVDVGRVLFLLVLSYGVLRMLDDRLAGVQHSVCVWGYRSTALGAMAVLCELFVPRLCLQGIKLILWVMLPAIVGITFAVVVGTFVLEGVSKEMERVAVYSVTLFCFVAGFSAGFLAIFKDTTRGGKVIVGLCCGVVLPAMSVAIIIIAIMTLGVSEREIFDGDTAPGFPHIWFLYAGAMLRLWYVGLEMAAEHADEPVLNPYEVIARYMLLSLGSTCVAGGVMLYLRGWDALTRLGMAAAIAAVVWVMLRVRYRSEDENKDENEEGPGEL